MRVRSLLTIGVLLGALSSAFGQSVSSETKDKVLLSMQNTIQRQAFVPGIDFTQWPAFLAKRQTEVDHARDVPTFVNTVNGALRDFGISHIRLLSPQNVKTRVSGVTQGFGMATQKSESGLLITAIAPKSPAAQLGLEQGDEIIQVEGIEKPVSYPVPPDNDTTALTIKRKSTGTVKHYMLAKKAYSTDQPNTLTWTNKDTAVLRIPSFSRTYSEKQIESFVAEVSQRKAKALILDLRSNGGGLVRNCQHLLSLLSQPGTDVDVR